MSKLQKTNAMRRLDASKINYEVMQYEVDESDLSGVHIASQIGLPCDKVFKTLVTRGDKTGITVFCIPCHLEIDLKLAAAVTGNKSISMMPTSELLANTGYIRGGCSPIGMKKKFSTFIDETAILFEEITVSAGIKGCQLIVNANELISFVDATLADLTT